MQRQAYIVFGLLLAFAASAYAAEKYPSISRDDLKKAMADQKVVLLDANGSEHFAREHIAGAIDFEAASKDLAKVLPADKDALVVAYCGSEKCGAYAKAAKAAADLGYTNVQHYAPGIKGWVAAGEKVESEKRVAEQPKAEAVEVKSNTGGCCGK
jgi:rhodanese-related sulfurtransferase